MLVEGPKKYLTNLHVKGMFEKACVAFCIGIYCTDNFADLSFQFLNDMASDMCGWVGLAYEHLVVYFI